MNKLRTKLWSAQIHLLKFTLKLTKIVPEHFGVIVASNKKYVKANNCEAK